jgi:hypothetical protein
MLTAIKGYYEHGKIILQEEAPVKEKTEVIVTFLSEKNGLENRVKRQPGGLKGKVSLPDDFNDPIDDLKEYM